MDEKNMDEKEAAVEYLIKKYGADEIRELIDKKSRRSIRKAK